MSKQFNASLDRLHEMLTFVRRYATDMGFSESHLYQIELSCGEALVNIINYAYPEKTGLIEIECIEKNKTSLEIIIKDQGIFFNPLNACQGFDIQSNVENAAIGGYGIFFILKNMDEVKYRLENSSNILTLIKIL